MSIFTHSSQIDTLNYMGLPNTKSMMFILIWIRFCEYESKMIVTLH